MDIIEEAIDIVMAYYIEKYLKLILFDDGKFVLIDKECLEIVIRSEIKLIPL